MAAASAAASPKASNVELIATAISLLSTDDSAKQSQGLDFLSKITAPHGEAMVKLFNTTKKTAELIKYTIENAKGISEIRASTPPLHFRQLDIRISEPSPEFGRCCRREAAHDSPVYVRTFNWTWMDPERPL
jgi:hypothetical protein